MGKLAKVEMLAKVGVYWMRFVGGNVTAVLNLLILVLIGLSVLAALFFLIRGVRSRSQSSREAYGVGQQDARRSMQIDIVRGVSSVFVGLVLLGVYGLSAGPTQTPVEPTFAPTTQPVATTISSPTATLMSSEPTATPTEPLPALTPTATASPIPEPTEELPTPTARTATVISEVGVWVRGAPRADGEQLEWALGGTILTLLPGLETADDFSWQQVRTPGGIEGWVAADYIEVNE